MNRFLLLLPLGVLAMAPLFAAVAAPAKEPQANEWARYAPEGTLLGYYDRIPAKHFVGFGGGSRRSFLRRKGAVVDYKRKFIEIPCPQMGSGEIQMLQISVFPNKKEPWIAVSRVVRAQNRVPGTLNFYYGYNDMGGLREAAPNFFPYKLKKSSGGFFENAYLPRKGLTIQIGLPDSRGAGPQLTYNPNAGVRESFFRRSG